MNVLVVGELNVDLLLSGYRSFPEPGKEVLVDDLTLALGSSSAICAAGLAKLGNTVSFVSKVGRDLWGDLCIEALESLGVSSSRIIRDSAVKTGLTASITSSKDRALVTYLGAIAELHRGDVPEAAMDGARHLHVSAYYLQNALRPEMRQLFKDAHARGLTTSLDTGYDPAETWGLDVLDVLEEVDVFLPNEVEIRAITERQEIPDALAVLQNGRTLTVAKLGADGAMALDCDKTVRVPGMPVQPIDTTGAGDSFNAGFLHAWLRRFSLPTAMQFACACGALSTLGMGGTGSQATEQQAVDFCRGNITLSRLS